MSLSPSNHGAPLARTTLSSILALVGAAALVGCYAEPGCPDGEVEIVGRCVVEAPEVPGPDTADPGPIDDSEPESIVVLQFTIEEQPSDNVWEVRCNDRRVFRGDRYTQIGTIDETFSAPPEQECVVTVRDERGGNLPAGSIVVCEEEVATWGPSRGLEREVARFTSTECIGGCTDPIAENYDPSANYQDVECEYIYGCTNPEAFNYDPSATRDDGSCDVGGYGLVRLTVYADATPEETTVALVCGDQGDSSPFIFLEPDEADAFRAVTDSRRVDGGFQCSVVMTDAAGSSGPPGIAEVCGERAAVWDVQPPDTRPWTRTVATFSVDACSGCTDSESPDYDPDARVDDGSCTYPLP